METLNRNLKDLSIEYPKPFENDAKKSESDNSAALPHLFLFLLFFSECNNIICFFKNYIRLGLLLGIFGILGL